MKPLLMVLVALLPVTNLAAQIGAELGAGQALAVVEDRPFEPAVQLLSEIDAGILVMLADWRLATGVGIAYQRASRLTASGVSYRGLVTRSAWISGTYSFSDPFRASAEARVSLANYELTSLLFFFPELRLGVDMDAFHATGAPVSFRLWAGYQFRQDLSFSLTAGLGARLRVEIAPAVR